MGLFIRWQHNWSKSKSSSSSPSHIFGNSLPFQFRLKNPVTAALIQFFTVLWMVITKFQSSHDLLLCQFDCCCWSTIENFLTNFIALMVDACAREVVLIDIKPIKMFVICVFFLIYQIQIQLGSAYEKKILGGLEAWDCNLIMYYYGVWHDTFSQIYNCNLLLTFMRLRHVIFKRFETNC